MLGWQDKLSQALTNITNDIVLLKNWSSADPPFSTPDGGIMQKLVHHTIQELCGEAAQLDPGKYGQVMDSADGIKRNVTAVLQVVRAKDISQFERVLKDLVLSIRDMKQLLESCAALPQAAPQAPLQPDTNVRDKIKKTLFEIQQNKSRGDVHINPQLNSELCVQVTTFLKMGGPTQQQVLAISALLKLIKEKSENDQHTTDSLLESMRDLNNELKVLEKAITAAQKKTPHKDSPRPKTKASRNKKQNDLVQFPKLIQTLKEICIHGDPSNLYTTDAKVGEGASGVVWKVQSKEHLTWHAMKKVPIKPETLEGIVKEITFMSTVKHPNALTFSGCFLPESKTEVCIVMELCEAGSVLDILMATGKGLEKEAYIIAILYQTLCGLAYLHDQNKIHRDIKAGNLLLTRHGEVKIADFGTSAEGVDRTTVIGSAFWMAPETIDSSGHGPKADIWSLGITLIEMTQKDPPNVKITNPLQVHSTILQAPSPTLKDPSLWSPQLKEIVDSCLKKDPKQRPSSKELMGHPTIVAAGPTASQDLIPLVQESILRKRQKTKEGPRKDGKEPSKPGRTLPKLSRVVTGQKGTGVTMNVSFEGKPIKFAVDPSITTEEFSTKCFEFFVSEYNADPSVLKNFVLYFSNPRKSEVTLVPENIAPFQLWREAHVGEANTVASVGEAKFIYDLKNKY